MQRFRRHITSYDCIPVTSGAGARVVPPNLRCIEAINMMNPDADSSRTAVVLMVLRVLSGASSGSDGKYSLGSFTPYNQRSKTKNTAKPYRRMYLCADLNSASGDCVYIIESDSINQKCGTSTNFFAIRISRLEWCS